MWSQPQRGLRVCVQYLFAATCWIWKDVVLYLPAALKKLACQLSRVLGDKHWILSIFHTSASKCRTRRRGDAWGVLDNVLLSAAMRLVMSPEMSFMPLMYVQWAWKCENVTCLKWTLLMSVFKPWFWCPVMLWRKKNVWSVCADINKLSLCVHVTLFNIKCVRNYETCMQEPWLARRTQKMGSKRCTCILTHIHALEHWVMLPWLNIEREPSKTALFLHLNPNRQSHLKWFLFLSDNFHLYQVTLPCVCNIAALMIHHSIQWSLSDSKWHYVCVFACSVSIEVMMKALVVNSWCPGNRSWAWFHLFSTHTQVIIMFVSIHNTNPLCDGQNSCATKCDMRLADYLFLYNVV